MWFFVLEMSMDFSPRVISKELYRPNQVSFFKINFSEI